MLEIVCVIYYHCDVSVSVRHPHAFMHLSEAISRLNVLTFTLYLNICGLRKGPGNFACGSWKVLDFSVSKSMGTLHCGFE